MTEPTNKQRGEWAYRSLLYFKQQTGLDNSGDTDETALGDLLANLRHMCDEQGIDFDEVCEGSKIVYEEELVEEAGWKG